MVYPDRIVIYLKAPDGGNSAKIDALKFIDPGKKSEESSFTPVDVSSGEEVCFILAATKIGKTEPGVADVYSLMVGWTGGCRIMSQVLLGEKGNNVGDIIGVGYTGGSADACSTLYCRFNGSGVLTCEDRQGVTLVTDVGKPGKEALCFAVVPRAGSTVSVVFPSKERNDLVV